MNNLEARIERMTEQILPEKPLVYTLDLRALASGRALTTAELTEGRRAIQRAAKAGEGRPFVFLTLRDEATALPGGERAAITEGETSEQRTMEAWKDQEGAARGM